MLDYASIYLYEMEEEQSVGYRMFNGDNYETLGNRTIGGSKFNFWVILLKIVV